MWILPDSGASPTILFNDSFTAADGTLLTAHAPDIGPGGDWLTDTTSCRIEGNKASCTAGDRQNVIDLGVALQGEVAFDFQFVDNAHHRQIAIDFNYNYGGGYGLKFRIANDGPGEVHAQDATGLHTYAAAFAAVNDTLVHHCRFRWDGRNLRAWIDNLQVANILVTLLTVDQTHLVIEMSSTTDNDKVVLDNLIISALN